MRQVIFDQVSTHSNASGTQDFTQYPRGQTGRVSLGKNRYKEEIAEKWLFKEGNHWAK